MEEHTITECREGTESRRVVRRTRADPSCQKAMVQWFGKFGDAKHRYEDQVAAEAPE